MSCIYCCLIFCLFDFKFILYAERAPCKLLESSSSISVWQSFYYLELNISILLFISNPCSFCSVLVWLYVVWVSGDRTFLEVGNFVKMSKVGFIVWWLRSLWLRVGRRSKCDDCFRVFNELSFSYASCLNYENWYRNGKILLLGGIVWFGVWFLDLLDFYFWGLILTKTVLFLDMCFNKLGLLFTFNYKEFPFFTSESAL